jgi:serine/threonine protein phosphatase PrpC
MRTHLALQCREVLVTVLHTHLVSALSLVSISFSGNTHCLEVKQVTLDSSDKFIIVASDGVWEFLSNEAIAKIVWPYYVKNSPEQAGNAIVRTAA